MNKRDFRKHALKLRAQVTGRAEKSSAIWDRLLAEFPFHDQDWICSYVDIDPEVTTRCYLQEFFFLAKESPSRPGLEHGGSQLAVPFCLPQHLNLFHLQDWSELTASHWGLHEPAHHLRVADRLIEPTQVDFFLVPGVAFDRSGNRLGYGKGYYDKLLTQRKPNSLAIALAFQDQVFEHVPHDPEYDISMDYIVTEEEVIDCRAEF